MALLIAVQGPPEMPAWLAGCWEQRSGERSAIERWSSPNGHAMEGESITRRGGLVVERESMRIVRSATGDLTGNPESPSMSFQATPAGRPATKFAWVPSDAPGLTFLNAAHDYPQRIRYWREARHLLAEIAAADGSKSRRWRYSPRRC